MSRLPDLPQLCPDAEAATERRDQRFDGVDEWSAGTILESLFEGQLAAVAAVRATLPGLTQVIDAALPRLLAGGRLGYAGAGTSGRIAFQDGAELRPTFGWPDSRLVCLLAGGTEALYRAVEGAEDGKDSGAADAARFGPNDVVLALAASGTTPYTRAVVQTARAAGSLTVGIANNSDAPLLRDAEIGIFLPTGPEPIAGSTRLKAGTAQKVVLNLISTTLMIKMGHVYRGWMVDMIASNEKLKRRTERMVAAITERSADDVSSALTVAGGNVKLAVLVLAGCDIEEARTLLVAAHGNLRHALLPEAR